MKVHSVNTNIINLKYDDKTISESDTFQRSIIFQVICCTHAISDNYVNIILPGCKYFMNLMGLFVNSNS